MKRLVGIIGVLFALAAAATAGVLLATSGGLAANGTTERVSVATDGAQGNGGSGCPTISADGRYVAFTSDASNLVLGDTNGYGDVFVHDRATGTTDRVSVSSTGTQANNSSYVPNISADGRYVAFESDATNLVLGDTNGQRDIFVRDRLLSTTERVSVGYDGSQANGQSYGFSISADGRYVAFMSWAANLVPGDANGSTDIFIRDRVLSTTERVSVGYDGSQANGQSYWPNLSADGRYVAFNSYASNLVSGDTNGYGDVFLRDRVLGTNERVSVSSTGAPGNHNSFSNSYAQLISADGRYVAFGSVASNLVTSDTNYYYDIFVRDRATGTTERVSIASDGTEANNKAYGGSMSADGRYVVFGSDASNLVSGDTNAQEDAFVRDRVAGTTERVSVSAAGDQANLGGYGTNMSADGRYVAFVSSDPNLVPGDTNGVYDVFVRDRLYSPPGVVVGRVDLQGRNNDSGALVQLFGYSTMYSDTTDAAGNFGIEAPPGAAYILMASMPGYLYASGAVTLTDGVTTTVSTVTLPGGDADASNDIDIYDLTVLGANFGLAAPPGDAGADINGDGEVNIFDLVLAGTNYGLAAPRPWP